MLYAVDRLSSGTTKVARLIPAREAGKKSSLPPTRFPLADRLVRTPRL